jgi:hypothetical protein
MKYYIVGNKDRSKFLANDNEYGEYVTDDVSWAAFYKVNNPKDFKSSIDDLLELNISSATYFKNLGGAGYKGLLDRKEEIVKFLTSYTIYEVEFILKET